MFFYIPGSPRVQYARRLVPPHHGIRLLADSPGRWPPPSRSAVLQEVRELSAVLQAFAPVGSGERPGRACLVSGEPTVFLRCSQEVL